MERVYFGKNNRVNEFASVEIILLEVSLLDEAIFKQDFVGSDIVFVGIGLNAVHIHIFKGKLQSHLHGFGYDTLVPIVRMKIISDFDAGMRFIEFPKANAPNNFIGGFQGYPPTDSFFVIDGFFHDVHICKRLAYVRISVSTQIFHDLNV